MNLERLQHLLQLRGGIEPYLERVVDVAGDLLKILQNALSRGLALYLGSPRGTTFAQNERTQAGLAPC